MLRIARREGFSSALADSWPGGLVPPEWIVTVEPKWTADLVREVLPDVPVEYKGRNMTAVVRGRKNRFASVCLNTPAVSYEYAWQTIADCLNKNGKIVI